MLHRLTVHPSDTIPAIERRYRAQAKRVGVTLILVAIEWDGMSESATAFLSIT